MIEYPLVVILLMKLKNTFKNIGYTLFMQIIYCNRAIINQLIS